MNYLYHRVPKNLQGNILYPLNTLKDMHPDIYQEHYAKYLGREDLTNRKIPILNCLWNDVLHFSPVHPKEIKKALIEAGRTADFEMTCYEIDPRVLDLGNTIAYVYNPENKINNPNPNSFLAFDVTQLVKYSVMPEKNKQYYKQMISEGKKPLLYPWVTHILYKGSLDISSLPIVTV